MKRKGFKKVLVTLLMLSLVLASSLSTFAESRKTSSQYIFVWWLNSGGILSPLTATGYSDVQEDFTYDWTYGYKCKTSRNASYASIKSYIPGGSVTVVVDGTIRFSSGQSVGISYYPCLTSDKYYQYKESRTTMYITPGSTATASASWYYYSGSGSLMTPIHSRSISTTM